MSNDDYRRGALNERRRAALACLRFTSVDGEPSPTGVLISNMIISSGKQLPVDAEQGEGWTMYAERRTTNDMPSFFEKRHLSPSEWGLGTIHRLEQENEDLRNQLILLRLDNCKGNE